ncbi:MAG: hypothetical protein DRJ66_04145 [Thermoprotei archaeon]|nr:MAG: hypothetical protein DRJ66_04145 [Thermoprotei archaeon]RLF18634.1 MAG: hypothetical protein DRZ82_07890 [Thermoprotei archaeon]
MFRKGKAFLEVLAIMLHEDYKFPVLELFVFLFVLSTFILMSPTSFQAITFHYTKERMIYALISAQMDIPGIPFLIFLILVLKNIAYGFGSDFEKGTIQVLLSYPLRRSALLTAKLISGLGIPLVMFVGIGIFALYVLFPKLVLNGITYIVISYLAFLSYGLLITAIILLLVIYLKRSGAPLAVGMAFCFLRIIARGLLDLYVEATKRTTPLKIISIFDSSLALRYYCEHTIWSPSSSEVMGYVIISYCLVLGLFLIAYYYFSRRLDI